MLGIDAQNMSQWKADHKRKLGSELVSHSPLIPPPNSIFPPCHAPVFAALWLSLWGLDAAACLCTISIYPVPLQIVSCCFPSTSLSPPLHNPFSDPLVTKSTIRKATSGILKGSTYASKSPTETSGIMTEATPLIWRWQPHRLSHSPSSKTHKMSENVKKKKKKKEKKIFSAHSLNQVTAIR